MTSFPAPVIWTAASDANSKFFAWLVLHNRVLTAQRIWPRETDPVIQNAPSIYAWMRPLITSYLYVITRRQPRISLQGSIISQTLLCSVLQVA
jgi:hypothetical protein